MDSLLKCRLANQPSGIVLLCEPSDHLTGSSALLLKGKNVNGVGGHGLDVSEPMKQREVG